MESIFIGEVEILKDGDRYYMIENWKMETYNGKEFKVPTLSFEIAEVDVLNIINNEERKEKLKRILYDL